MLISALGSVRRQWSLGLTLGVMTLVFFGTFQGGFLADDFVYVSLFADRSWLSWPQLFVREWSEGVWGFQLKELRPFSALSFMIDARLWGGQATGYRLTNFLLHAGAVLLVMRLVRARSDGSALPALVAGLVFALHPIAVEPVAWITGRSDVLATLCALLFWCGADAYEKNGRRLVLVAAGAAYGVSAFSKEYGLAAPLLLASSWLLVAPRVSATVWKRRLAVLVSAGAVVAIYALCRQQAFGEAAASSWSGWRDPAVWQRQASYVGWLLPVLPFTTGSEWASPPPSGVIQGLWLSAVAGVTAATVVCAWRGHAVRARLFFFGGCWPLFTLGLLLVVHYFTPRHLYFVLVGPAVALGLLVSAANGRAARWGLASASVLWVAWAQAVALEPWREAGRVSADALRALDRIAGEAPPGAMALLAVPARIGPALLWPWVSPQVAGAHFIERGFSPDAVLESGENYCRPDRWPEERMALALARLGEAQSAVVLYVDREGNVHGRTIDGPGLREAAAKLAPSAENGIDSSEWAAWVRSIAVGS